LPSTFQATRYHSLIVQEPLPDELQVLARTPEGELMALGHRAGPTYGVQFHPESVLTLHGKRLLQNFLQLDRVAVGEARVASAPALDLPTAIERALAQEHLSAEEAEAVMLRIMAGEATPAQIGAFLAALRAKGETVAEITGFARAMRRHATPVRPSRRPLVDTCGTGGDRAHTFNISTTAAFVVAGAGVAVAKHGNRSVSSRCGSADVLQALGVKLELSPEAVARCIDEVGFGFLFAPLLHPAMKHAIGPRREMGVRTVFNILGPLTNPAGASLQLVGVYDGRLVEPVADVLSRAGGRGGLCGAQRRWPGRAFHHRASTISPPCAMASSPVSSWMPRNWACPGPALEALRGGDAAENARLTREILDGVQGPRRDVVLLNAGMALVAAGVAPIRGRAWPWPPNRWIAAGHVAC
jgi:anthranilate phosphoribosyltransferase